jgi:DNA-directed RNA polymerase subunit RPC12/RpoP
MMAKQRRKHEKLVSALVRATEEMGFEPDVVDVEAIVDDQLTLNENLVLLYEHIGKEPPAPHPPPESHEVQRSYRCATCKGKGGMIVVPATLEGGKTVHARRLGSDEFLCRIQGMQVGQGRKVILTDLPIDCPGCTHRLGEVV